MLTVFLAIPWLAYAYVDALERFLRESQERTLAGTAQAVATALHDRPALFAPPKDPWNPGAPEIDEMLQGLSRTTSRIFVVDAKGNVLARVGSLRRPAAVDEAPASGPARVLAALLRYTLDPLYAAMLKQPTEEFSDDFLDRPVPFQKELDGALAGILTTDRRASSDGKVGIVAAAHPIWVGDRVQGAVVVEETTNAVLAERNRAFERLFTLVLALTLVGAVALTLFATRLSSRIRGLRDEVEQAIDAKGNVRHIASGSQAGDEIGDLSRSFSSVLARLADAASHREHLANRLSHELRTPIAVVRSSLDNLQGDAMPDDVRVYLARAQGGLDRLAQILTRMSEATRLEQSVGDADFEQLDLVALARACVDGYRSAYRDREFIFDAPASAIELRGAPDQLAQMLDKLVANAVEFGTPGRPVVVRVERAGDAALLSVSNEGPLLPEAMRDRLFESMVSVRDENAGDAVPHLGLGLYIVRLVANLHGGSARADNRADGSGVVMTITLPVAAG